MRIGTFGLLALTATASFSAAVPKSVFGHRVSMKLVETVDDVAGTVTFAAECCVNGLMLIVK